MEEGQEILMERPLFVSSTLHPRLFVEEIQGRVKAVITSSIPKGGSSRTGSLNLRLQTAFITLVSCLLFIASPVNAGPGRAITSPAAGAVYYVDGLTGNDVNGGPSAAPWRTIQKAASTLRAGETVIVNPGTYNERVSITSSGSTGNLITFQAQGTVVMQGFNIQASYVKITGFEIANTSGSGWSDRSNGSGVYLSGSNDEISNNYVHNTTAAGIFFTSSVSNSTVSGNRVAYGVECGIYIQGSGNLIASNDVSHTHDVGGSDADGIRFFGSGNTVRKNYIHAIILSESPGESPHIDAFQTWGPATDYTFEQNLIDKDPSQQQGFTIEGIKQPVGNITIRNNVFISRGNGYNTDVNVGDIGPVTNVTIVNNTMVAMNGPAENAIWLLSNLIWSVVN